MNATKYHYSNGPLEGVNRKIKQIIRTSYGVQNYHNLVIQVTTNMTTLIVDYCQQPNNHQISFDEKPTDKKLPTKQQESIK